jgi:hypothetical protein
VQSSLPRGIGGQTGQHLTSPEIASRRLQTNAPNTSASTATALPIAAETTPGASSAVDTHALD